MLPKKVHEKNGAWYYVSQNKWHHLCRCVEGEHVLYKRLSEVLNPQPRTLNQIFPLYLADAELADETRKKYAQVIQSTLSGYFGHMAPDDVGDSDIAQFLELRKSQGAAVTGNRECATLSSVFEYSMRRGWASRNPCRGVRRNKERRSKRYVANDEFIETYGRSNYALQLFLNALYLSGMRITDLMILKRSQLMEKGIEWTESKTKKDNFMMYKPGLLEVLKRAIEHGDSVATKITKRLPHPRPLPAHVFVNSRGKRWTQWGVSSAMRRAKATFAPRHLRPKAQTDAGDVNVIGHVGQMREVYTRRRKLTPVA